jgi:hypothetical protein
MESNWVHLALRPPMAYCASPGWLWWWRKIGGMIGRGNRSTRRKPAPVQLCPPQISHAARTGTRAAAVGSQRLTAWATARPCMYICPIALERKIKQTINSNVDIINQYYWFLWTTSFFITTVFLALVGLMFFLSSCKVQIVTLPLCCFINWSGGCCPYVCVCL